LQDAAMSSVDINSVLSQIRTLSQQAGAKPAGLPPLRGDIAARGAQPTQPGNGFSDLVRDGIQNVADAQSSASAQQRAFELGDPNTDLATVMVASAKAQVSFRAMVEVRNRVVSAYQEVMNMPL
jgi:flagellar hook-basal body complex protein FliE